MKKKKFNELIQKPLRFHHQDIHEELEEIKGMLKNVSYQMQELRDSIRGAPVKTPLLPVPKPYVHPWWQHQWTGLVSGRNNNGSKVQTPAVSSDQSGSSVSGGTEETQGETTGV